LGLFDKIEGNNPDASSESIILETTNVVKEL